MHANRATYLLQELGLIHSRVKEVLMRSMEDDSPPEGLGLALLHAMRKIEVAQECLRSLRKPK